MRVATCAMAKGAKLLVLGTPTSRELDVLGRLPSGAEIVKVGERFDDVSDATLADVDCVLLGGGAVRGMRATLEEVWPRLPGLKWIHSSFAGLDGFLFPGLVESDVVVTNAKGVFSQSLAEYALFACKYFALDFPRMHRQRCERRWEQFAVGELAGATLAIVGYGDIGASVGRLGKAHGMRVVACRRNPAQTDPAVVDEMFASIPEDVHRMVQQSDFVVSCLPLTSSTRGMLDAAFFDAMNSEGVFVNVGRGPTVVEADLIAALEKKSIKAAALDVFEVEPLPKDSPLWDMHANVLITYHNADQVEPSKGRPSWLEASMIKFTQNMQRYIDGGMTTEPLLNVVDVKKGY